MSKEYTIFKATSVITNNDAHSSTQFAVAKGGEEMKVSDGYHTMDELYDHRISLYISLCKYVIYHEAKLHGINDRVWRSKVHSDGSVMKGWFILGIGKKKGEQITYHIPLYRWDDIEIAQTLEKAPEWDGHSSNDVLARLIEL